MIIKEFINYIKKHNVLALAIGVMIANSVALLTNSLVKDIVTPVLDPVIKMASGNVDLNKLKIEKGPFRIEIGKFIQNLIQFIIVGLVIVTIIKYTH
jgi:large conductance mechanosensitive channel protein